MTTKTSKKPTILAPRSNSKKARVFGVFKSKGRDAAVKYGRGAMHLKTSTLATWCSTWKNSTVKARPINNAA